MYKLSNPAPNISDRLLQYNKLCNDLPDVQGICEFQNGNAMDAQEEIARNVSVTYYHSKIHPTLLSNLREYAVGLPCPFDTPEGLRIGILHDRRNPLEEVTLSSIVQHLRSLYADGPILLYHIPATNETEMPGYATEKTGTIVPYLGDEITIAVMSRMTCLVYTDSVLAYMMAQACDIVAACPLHDLPGRTLPVVTGWPRFRHIWSYGVYFDVIYLINLERRPDRLAEITAVLERHSLRARRIAAVDGKKVTWDVQKMGNQTRYWNSGAFGCLLSHREAIRDAYVAGHERFLILEDDVILADNFSTVLSQISLPDDWYLLYLSANLSKPVTYKMGDKLYRITDGLGTHAIIWHRRAIEPCMQFLAGPYAPWDLYLSYFQTFFPCYITAPGLADVRPGVSDILGMEVDYGKVINYLDPLAPSMPAQSTISLAMT